MSGNEHQKMRHFILSGKKAAGGMKADRSKGNSTPFRWQHWSLQTSLSSDSTSFPVRSAPQTCEGGSVRGSILSRQQSKFAGTVSIYQKHSRYFEPSFFPLNLIVSHLETNWSQAKETFTLDYRFPCVDLYCFDVMP